MTTVGFWYRCSSCEAVFKRDTVRYLCPVCSKGWKPGQPLQGVLRVEFDWLRIAELFNPEAPDWSLFCPIEKEHLPAYPVGNTPLFAARTLGDSLGLDRLYIKNDGQNPSGSLKDRASFLVAAEAKRIGERTIVCASTGNAASALAAVCANAGLEAVIFVPASAPRAKLVQTAMYGADLRKVDGSYDDAFGLSIQYTDRNGGLNRNTAYHPLTIEGKKTVALEIFSGLGMKAPDNVVVPVGDGVIISGVYKGFSDLRDAGLIDGLPRLICVQAAASDAIHNLIETGSYRDAGRPDTVADSISVRVPSNAYMAARGVRDSGGFSVTVTDPQIMKAQRRLASAEGVFAEPAAAAGVAGLEVAADRIGRGETTVLLVTGHGLKDVEAPVDFGLFKE